MSVFTKQAKEAKENLPIYLAVVIFWVICSLVLTGLTRQAWGGDSPSRIEMLFCFGVTAMNFATLYYLWLNGYLFFRRNRAGSKRDILEADADQRYRR